MESVKEKRYALITGITGQDGSYLLEFLLEHPDYDYEVFGVMRRNSTFTTGRIDHVFDHPRLHNHYGDVSDPISILGVIRAIEGVARKDSRVEVYNLAAQSHVGVSFEVPLYTAQIDAIGTLNVLEAIRNSRHPERFRFYQASTSEMFGAEVPPQSETTRFHPRSPYGVAKLYAHWITQNYRESYDMFACSGVLFNHESERRGETFVTRKITLAVGKIARGEKPGPYDYIELGNLDSKRDWGYAPDYIRAMWLMLQSETPKDYVIATGEARTVRQFVEAAFKIIGVDVVWRSGNEPTDEIGVNNETGKTLVKVTQRCFRPAEVDYLLGDATLAKRDLGWEPSISFEELVKRMVEHDRDVNL